MKKRVCPEIKDLPYKRRTVVKLSSLKLSTAKLSSEHWTIVLWPVDIYFFILPFLETRVEIGGKKFLHFFLRIKEIKISFWDFLTFRMHQHWSHYFPYLEPVKLQLANIAATGIQSLLNTNGATFLMTSALWTFILKNLFRIPL